MSNNRTHYEVLGVAPDATADQIKKAYRSLALQCHPDKSPDDANKAAELNEAYRVLSDDDLRAHYDRESDMVEEEVFEMPEPSVVNLSSQDSTETSNSLVVFNQMSLNSVMQEAGMKKTDLYANAWKDINLARTCLEDPSIAEHYKLGVIEEHEELALNSIKNDKLSKEQKFTLAIKFASVCISLLEDEVFINGLTLAQCHKLYVKHIGNKEFSSSLAASPKLHARNKKHEDKIDNILNQDNEQNRKMVAEWLDEVGYERQDVVKLAEKHAVVAYAIFDLGYSDVIKRLGRFYVSDVALQHESIALQLMQTDQYDEILADVDCGSGNKTPAYLLAKKFARFHEALINSTLTERLPVSEQIVLLENIPMNGGSEQQSRICAYRLLTGDVSQASESDIIKLIEQAGLLRKELLKLAELNIAIARAITSSDTLITFLGIWVDDFVEKYEELAKRFVTEDRLKKYLYCAEVAVLNIARWKSACCIILKDEKLRAELSAENLFNLEKMHGADIARLIFEAGLQGKMLAYDVIKQMVTQKGGVKISKKRVKRSEKQDDGELLYQRGLTAMSGAKNSYGDEKIKAQKIALFYFTQAARKGNANAFAELVKQAEQTHSLAFEIEFMETCLVTDDKVRADQAADEIDAYINEEQKLVNLLTTVQNRLLAPENKDHSVMIGNFYFDLLTRISEKEVFANSAALYTTYRYFADLFQESDHGTAVDYLTRVPADSRTQADWLNLAEWTNAHAYKTQEAVLSDQPPEEKIRVLNDPDMLLRRYRAPLPYYLIAGAQDEIALSRSKQMLKSLMAIDLPEKDKGSALLEIGWEVASTNKLYLPQAKLAWDESANLGNPFARYAIDNLALLQADEFVFQELKRISQGKLETMLPLLDIVQKLPRETVIKAAAETLLAKPSIIACNIENRMHRWMQNENKLSSIKRKLEQFVAPRISDLKLAARLHRSNDDHNLAASCGIRADILSDLQQRLVQKVENYYSQDFLAPNAPLNDDQLHRELIATVNAELTTINSDLKDHAAWYVMVAYGLMKVLHGVFSCSTTVAGWMNTFENRFKVMPDTESIALTSNLLRRAI